MRRSKMTVLVLAVGLLVSCGSDTPVSREAEAEEGTNLSPPAVDVDVDMVCPAIVNPGIVVEIRDAITDAPLADSASAVVTDGDFRAGLTPAQPTAPGVPFSRRDGAYERPGQYDLRVTREGYRTWQRSGIEVDSDRCGVRTVTILVLLEPDPSGVRNQ